MEKQKINKIIKPRTKHLLINPRANICKICGEFFKIGERTIYCSKECYKQSLKEKQRRNRKNDNEYYDEHPEVCRRCGKIKEDVTSKFKFCLECRTKTRKYIKQIL